jgi:hypothetical protein
MNANQIIYLQSGIGVALALVLFMFFYVKMFRCHHELRLVKASSSAIAVMALAWGLLLCGVFQGSFAETFTAAFSHASVSAEPWGTPGLFRILTVALGLSLTPWALTLLVLSGGVF